jgi:hypothetical protein
MEIRAQLERAGVRLAYLLKNHLKCPTAVDACGLWKHLALETRPKIAFGSG